MSWADADGQDGSRLQNKIFQVYCLVSWKTKIMHDYLFGNPLNIFLLVFYKHFMFDKGA